MFVRDKQSKMQYDRQVIPTTHRFLRWNLLRRKRSKATGRREYIAQRKEHGGFMR